MWYLRTKSKGKMVGNAISEFQKLSLSKQGQVQNLVVKMSCICMRMKNHFHISGFALSLALKQRLVATPK